MLRSNSLPTESVGKEWCSTFGRGGAGELGGRGNSGTRAAAPNEAVPPPQLKSSMFSGCDLNAILSRSTSDPGAITRDFERSCFLKLYFV